MIKHTIEKEYLKIFYNNSEPYPISLKELGQKADWRVAQCDEEIIVIRDVSRWTLHLLTTRDRTKEFAYDFMNLVKQYAPDNHVNWEQTERAITIYDEYQGLRCKIPDPESESRLKTLSEYQKPKPQIKEIIKALKLKYEV